MIVLTVLDGWGYSKKLKGNCIKLAKTPNFDFLVNTYPNCFLKTFGSEVGLPPEAMGGSEVGHEHMGAGRIVKEERTIIDELIESGKFYKCKSLKNAMENKRVHLIGLVSDKGVHSSIYHLFALLEAAKKFKTKEVYIHFIADGRDSTPQSAAKYAQMLIDKINELHIGCIATICGRHYAMDRDQRWNRVQKAFKLMTKGRGEKAADVFDAINTAYKKVENDQYIPPFVINKNGVIKKKDAIFMFNFRSDRMREITKLLFKYNKRITAMVNYYNKLKFPIIVEPSEAKNTFGEYISDLGMKQMRIAETEKYAHVTYFFNNGKRAFKGEDRILIPSPSTITYDRKPEMSAEKITQAAVRSVKSKKYDFILINYANADMVGHTGNIRATVKAVEFVDACLGKLINACKEANATLAVTSDHGNADEKYDENGNLQTSHSYNSVYFIICTNRQLKLKKGGLKNIAPTLLDFMGIEKPKEMTAKSLLF